MHILSFDALTKVFRSGLTGRCLYTLGPVSLDVQGGEVFGYLGPNGAGKTTTIKLALGLLRPSGGRVTCFGERSTSPCAKRRIGYLPEQPYFYQHLTALELMEFYGDMFGLSRREKRRRAEHLLDLTGLGNFRNTRLSKFSKGMLQRIGLAQALVNDPDLVVLDEPLSGLDPVGRRELRSLILELRAQGKTVFLSSHILQDIEMVCDRVAILQEGKVLRVASVREVMGKEAGPVEIAVRDLPVQRAGRLGVAGAARRGDMTVVTVAPGDEVNRVISDILGCGGRIWSVTPVRETLEDYFMRQVGVGLPGRSDSAPAVERISGTAVGVGTR
jgi:ABC-2 type transport system ATP-binding protein